MSREEFETICRQHPDWVPDEVVYREFMDRGLITDEDIETFAKYA